MIGTAESIDPPPAETSPARFLLPPLLLLLALLPPEARGESMAGCAALLAIFVALTARAVRGWDALLVPLVALLALAASLASDARSLAVEPVAMFTLAAAAGLAAASCTRSRAGGAAPALVLAGSLVSAHALVQVLGGLAGVARELRQGTFQVPDQAAVLARLEANRAFAGFATPAALGGFLALSLPLTVALALGARGAKRWLLSGAILLQGVGLLATASVTAILSLFAALAAAALLSGRARGRVALGLVALAMLLAAAVWQRDGLLDPGRRDNPLKLRAGNFRAAIEVVEDHPWLGVGPGAFGDAYPRHRRPGDNETRHAHNLPLELMAELGIPAGLLLSLLFFSLFLRPLLGGPRQGWQQGAAVGLAAFALHNLADFTAFLPSVLWSASLLLGLAWPRGEERAGSAVSASGRPVVAAFLLATVLLAAVPSARAGLAWNARVAAREAAFAGENDSARALAERAAALAPWSADSALLLARVTLAAEDPLALDRAERAVRLAPHRAAARAVRASARMRSGDPEGAYADLHEATALYPMAAEYRAALERLREGMVPPAPIELGSPR